MATGANLHSDKFPAPVSAHEYEVAGSGEIENFNDDDYWRVEIFNDLSGTNADQLKSLTSQFRLKHVRLGCYLRAPSTSLPAWGFKQWEVVCQKSADPKSRNNWWNIEQHWNDKCKFKKTNIHVST